LEELPMASSQGRAAKDYDHFVDPGHSLGYLSRIALRSFSHAMERRTLLFGVSAGQWQFLCQLWVEDGLTQGDLSSRVGTRASTAVTAVNSLVRSGLVKRVPCATDRRKIYVFLTQRAKDLQAELLPKVATVNALATRGIPASDLVAFRKVLVQINANLAQDAVRPLVCGVEA
jgi:MarR family transcriptional regulator, transcriptional regulator for hemolysin